MIGLFFLGLIAQEVMAQKNEKNALKEKEKKDVTGMVQGKSVKTKKNVELVLVEEDNSLRRKKSKKHKQDVEGGQGNLLIEFKTKAKCENCEVLLQDKLLAITGIRLVNLDFDTETIEVRYNSFYVSESDIKTAILAAGFSADGEKGEKEARKNLPDCCK